MFDFLLQGPGADTIDKVVNAIADSVKTGITNVTAAADPNAGGHDFSVFSMLKKGGFMMIPIGFLFVLVLFLLFERLMVISKASKKNASLLVSIKDLVGKGNIDSARALCNSMNTPENIMIEKGLSRIGNPYAEIKDAMNDAGKVELGRLEKRMSMLNIIGRIAPMLGFIGTIIGVINIFLAISIAKKVDIGTISEGLYEKMVCSASGLVVGVFAFIAYHWMMGMIDKLALRLEESQMKFMDILQEPSK